MEKFKIQVWMSIPYGDIICVRQLKDNEIICQLGWPENDIAAEFEIQGRIRANVLTNQLSQGLSVVEDASFFNPI